MKRLLVSFLFNSLFSLSSSANFCRWQTPAISSFIQFYQQSFARLNCFRHFLNSHSLLRFPAEGRLPPLFILNHFRKSPPRKRSRDLISFFLFRGSLPKAGSRHSSFKLAFQRNPPIPRFSHFFNS